MTTNDRLIRQFLSKHPDVALRIINDLDTEAVAGLLEQLPQPQAVTVLSGLVPYRSARCLERLPVERAGQLVAGVETSVADLILRQTSKALTKQILEVLPKELRLKLQTQLKYSRDLVGAFMDSRVLSVSDQLTVAETIEQIKKHGNDVYTELYVVNDQHDLIGYVAIKNLLVQEPDLALKSILQHIKTKVFVNMSIKDLMAQWDDYFLQLPVVNSDGKFLGIIGKSALQEGALSGRGVDQSAAQASNALGDLYMIGLTSLFGSSQENHNASKSN